MDDLISKWKKDEAAIFEGWDFSYIKNRYAEEKPPWDYVSLAKELVKDSSSLLDMATGGGEIFSQMAPFPKRTYAIEGYHPNVVVAKKNLEPLGVKVIEADPSRKLPFTDEEFDLVINRHGGYNVKELKRILKHKGQFITQQVGSNNLSGLRDFFGTQPKWQFNALERRIAEFKKHGFAIKRTESWEGKMTFHDVGATVYFLKAVPWVVDDFSVDRHLSYLEKLQKQLEKNGKLEFKSSRYLLRAKKA